MLKFIAVRVLFLIPIIIGVTFISFVLLHIAPGDPAQLIAGEGATVTKTSGTYNSANAGFPYTGRTVTVSLAGSDYTPTGSTLLSNYVLPTSAAGGGE